MSNEDTRGEEKGGRIESNGFSNNDHNSIFQIMDRIMTGLNKTKKIFVFMFFSMTILPVTTIIIFMYTFDDPKIDRVVLKTNIQESSLLTQKLKNQMIQLEICHRPKTRKNYNYYLILKSIKIKSIE